jgi:hypothetical protein
MRTSGYYKLLLPLVVLSLFAQEIAPICAPRSPGLAFNCWRDKPKPVPETDSVPAAIRSARDAAASHGPVSNPNPFPIDASDVVALMTFTGFTPRSSPQGLYTELLFKVNEVLRQSRVKVKAGDDITSTLPGAAIQLPTGKTIRQFPDGCDDLPLHLGNRYLAFLKYNHQTDTYIILKHWGLANGRLVITDITEMAKAAQGNPSIRPGTRESDITDRIRQGGEAH